MTRTSAFFTSVTASMCGHAIEKCPLSPQLYQNCFCGHDDLIAHFVYLFLHSIAAPMMLFLSVLTAELSTVMRHFATFDSPVAVDHCYEYGTEFYIYRLIAACKSLNVFISIPAIAFCKPILFKPFRMYLIIDNLSTFSLLPCAHTFYNKSCRLFQNDFLLISSFRCGHRLR